MRIIFKGYYLCAVGHSIHSEHRATERTKGRRPKVVKFAGARAGPGGEAMGTLYMTDEIYNKWFAGEEMLPQMGDAKSAAEYLVANNAHVHYGCPLCLFLTDELEVARKHVEEEYLRFLQYVDVVDTEEEA